ncbi:hypothetical protein ACRAWF_39375 [Streptomyces sp. L7]
MQDGRSTEGVRDKAPHFFLSYAPVPSPVGDVDAARPGADKDVREFYADLSRAVAGASGRFPLVLPRLSGRRRPRRTRDGTCPAPLPQLRAPDHAPLLHRRALRPAVVRLHPPCPARRPHPGTVDAGTDHRPPGPRRPGPARARAAGDTGARRRDRAGPLREGGGLYGLRQRYDHPEYYEQCVRRIAQCVVEAVRQAPGTHAGRNGVHRSGHRPRRVRRLVLAPARHRRARPGRQPSAPRPQGHQVRPRATGLAAASATATPSARRTHRRTRPQSRLRSRDPHLRRGRTRLSREREARSPWVLILDPWILYDRTALDRLRAFDARDLPWVTVLTPLADDPQTRNAREELATLLRSALPPTADQRPGHPARRRGGHRELGGVQLPLHRTRRQRGPAVPQPTSATHLTQAPVSVKRPHAATGGPVAPLLHEADSQGDQEAQP